MRLKVDQARGRSRKDWPASLASRFTPKRFCSWHLIPYALDGSGGNGEDAMFRFVKRLR